MSEFADLVSENLNSDLFDFFGVAITYTQGGNTLEGITAIREDVSTEYANVENVRAIEADYIFKIEINDGFAVTSGETTTPVTPDRKDEITFDGDTYDVILAYKDALNQIWILETRKVDA